MLGQSALNCADHIVCHTNHMGQITLSKIGAIFIICLSLYANLKNYLNLSIAADKILSKLEHQWCVRWFSFLNLHFRQATWYEKQHALNAESSILIKLSVTNTCQNILILAHRAKFTIFLMHTISCLWKIPL